MSTLTLFWPFAIQTKGDKNRHLSSSSSSASSQEPGKNNHRPILLSSTTVFNSPLIWQFFPLCFPNHHFKPALLMCCWMDIFNMKENRFRLRCVNDPLSSKTWEARYNKQTRSKPWSCHGKHHLSISQGTEEQDQMLELTLKARKLIKLFLWPNLVLACVCEREKLSVLPLSKTSKSAAAA